MWISPVIFGVGNRFPDTSALSLRVVVEERFIDEGDFVNKGKGFTVKDNLDCLIDSSVSLDLADS